jgi:YbbR domain-containing protein
MLQKLRSLVFDNFIIKLFSVVFAAILWLHVITRGTSEVDFVVPLELRDIPDDMVVVGDVPGVVDVRVQGQEAIVKRMTVKDISAFISLKGAKPGEGFYNLTRANISVPGKITVSSISPSDIRLKLEKLMQKELPVKPVIQGKPAAGYVLEKVEVMPAIVGARGPAAALRRIYGIDTEKVDIDGASGGFEKMVKLDAPENVKLDEDSVKVVVTAKPKRQAK